MAEIVTFGEIMMRLAAPGHLRFSQAHHLEVSYGGGEANVAVSLAQFGHDVTFVTRLPNNPFGEAAISMLRGNGVDTRHVLRRGDRIGIYFLETGASQRPSVVVYDRSGSSISQIGEREIDWGAVFRGASWFHFTGITPALGPNAAASTLAAARAARSAGLTISCDLNYRKKLWSPLDAGRCMTELMEYVDIAVGNEEDAANVFGIHAPGTDVTAGTLDPRRYEPVAHQLVERFGLQAAAITLRESRSADVNGWAALILKDGVIHHSRRFNIQIVDRVGGGDAFAAGLIHGLRNGMPTDAALEFATAASCLAHSIVGDYNLATEAEVKALMGGDGSGRVQR